MGDRTVHLRPDDLRRRRGTPHPDLPVVTIADLGVMREVRLTDGMKISMISLPDLVTGSLWTPMGKANHTP